MQMCKLALRVCPELAAALLSLYKISLSLAYIVEIPFVLLRPFLDFRV